MTMSDLFMLALVFIAGAGLGLFFYGTLWWTVRRGLMSPRPALWFFCSWLLRMSIVATGIVLVADQHWERLLVCLLGFMVARVVVTWLTRMPVVDRVSGDAQATHAP